MKKISLTQQQFDRLIKIYVKGGFIVVLAIVIAFSIFLNKLPQTIILLLSFFTSQLFYKQQFHAGSLKVCTLLSICLFTIIIYLLPYNISFMIPAVIGMFVAYFSCKAGTLQIRLNKYNDVECKYTELLNLYDNGRIIPRQFDINTCTEEELIYRCRELNFTQRNIDFCVKMFIDKVSIKDYINSPENIELHLDEQQERNRKTRLKKALTNNK